MWPTMTSIETDAGDRSIITSELIGVNPEDLQNDPRRPGGVTLDIGESGRTSDPANSPATHKAMADEAAHQGQRNRAHQSPWRKRLTNSPIDSNGQRHHK